MGLYYNNTFIIADVATDMRALESIDKMMFMVPGPTPSNAGPVQWWRYDGNSVEADNGITVLKPNILTNEQPGRYKIMTTYVTTGLSILSSPTRTFNTEYTPSLTNDVLVFYSVRAVTTLSLTAGQTTKITVEISPNGTVWSPVTASEGGLTGTLIVGLNINAANGGSIAAFVPKGYQVRLNTAGTTSGVTPTIVSQQEVSIG